MCEEPKRLKSRFQKVIDHFHGLGWSPGDGVKAQNELSGIAVATEVFRHPSSIIIQLSMKFVACGLYCLYCVRPVAGP